MKIKLLSLCLAGMMVAGTVGCALNEAGQTVSETAVAAEAIEGVETRKEQIAEKVESTVSDEIAPAEELEDITEVNILLWQAGCVIDEAKAVEDAVNEITESKIGVHVNIENISVAEYPTYFGLKMAGGEPVDLAIAIPMGAVSFQQMYANNQLKDITDLANEYAPDIVEMMGDYLDACRVNDRLYGIPSFRDYGQSIYLYMRKDILEDLGMVEMAENATSWSEIEEIFAAVRDNTDLAPILGSAGSLGGSAPGAVLYGDKFSEGYSYDSIGDTNRIIYVDDNGIVSLLPEHDGYRYYLDRVRSWRDQGFMYKDDIISNESSDVLIRDNVGFAAMQPCEYGALTIKQSETGYDLVMLDVLDLMLSSANVNKLSTVVPITSEEPEAALKFLNEMYTNPEVENLLMWGIEGTHYQVVDGEATYLEGKDINNCGYHYRDFIWGNNFNAYPWNGSGKTFREETFTDLQNYAVSPFLGFISDFSGMENILTAQASVLEQYSRDIQLGNYTDEYYEKYVSAVKAADSDAYIEALQKQLDAWTGNN